MPRLRASKTPVFELERAATPVELDISGPGWMRDAACRGMDREPFFPEGSKLSVRLSMAAAKRVCEGCPVRGPCLAWALSFPVSHDVGVWGGLSQDERIQLRKLRQSAGIGEPDELPPDAALVPPPATCRACGSVLPRSRTGRRVWCDRAECRRVCVAERNARYRGRSYTGPRREAIMPETTTGIEELFAEAWRAHGAMSQRVGPLAERLAALRLEHRTRDDLLDVVGRSSGYRRVVVAAMRAAYGVPRSELRAFRRRDEVLTFERTVRNHVGRIIAGWAAEDSGHPQASEIREALAAQTRQEPPGAAQPAAGDQTAGTATSARETVTQAAAAVVQFADGFGADDVQALRELRDAIDAVLTRLREQEAA